MERAITASDANQRFSELLREVQDGETFVVTSRGRPVAKVVPVDDLDRQAPAIDALLAHVETLPRRSLAGWARADLYE
ncbi:type II toxin-antitoxin system Phd/YefM family antitoxin [Sphingomonas lenta]|uniref:type II toxin-antitoxin system Phd/YefM family antitoxin n=1 Tax=Sphingomonas lenta TaxID=1141887 RepID=UPI00159541A3|nr:type II toxin-antitoxin system Phd/YefM family antitoxin [Sphingomonas lenta]